MNLEFLYQLDVLFWTLIGLCLFLLALWALAMRKIDACERVIDAQQECIDKLQVINDKWEKLYHSLAGMYSELAEESVSRTKDILGFPPEALPPTPAGSDAPSPNGGSTPG